MVKEIKPQHKEENHHIEQPKLLEQLLKPEQNIERINPELLKKKKRKRHHLIFNFFTNDKKTIMDTETMESMWHEILNEQKETNKLNKQLFSKMEYLSGKTETIEKEPNNRQKITSPADTKVFHEIITEGIGSIKQVIAAQPKNVIHQKQIMIFPEFKSPECYRLLFNCIIYITIVTYSFLIIKVIVDHWCK